LLIDLEHDKAARAVMFGLLAEIDRDAMGLESRLLSGHCSTGWSYGDSRFIRAVLDGLRVESFSHPTS
jgi:hypothetical protein